MSKKIEPAIEIIEGLAEKLHYEPSLYTDSARTHIKLERHGSPIITHFEIQKDNTAFIYFYIRTTSWDFGGERTDLHDCLSTLLAAHLRLSPIHASCSFWDVPHPAAHVPDTEIYARYLTIDQSSPPVFLVEEKTTQQIEELLSQMIMFEIMFSGYVDCTPNEQGDYEQGYSYDETTAWAEMVSKVIREPFDSQKIQWNTRTNPTWKFYRSIRTNLSLYHAPGLSFFMNVVSVQQQSWDNIDGINGQLFLSDGVSNIISFKNINFARRILAELDDENTFDEMVLIPLENSFVAAGGSHVLFMRRDCGQKRFEQEKERIRKRHKQEEELLFPITSFVWSEKIGEDDFERLIQDLLEEEKGVEWVRQVGPSKERDRGKDLLCEWETAPLPHEVITEEQSPYKKRLILVQCKARKKTVGKAEVKDIRDTIEDHDAQGYFLAVSNRLTSGLTDHLLKMKQEGKFYIDWWTRDQIEKRLKAFPNIAAKYPNVVQAKRGLSEAEA